MENKKIFEHYWETKTKGNNYLRNYMEITEDWRSLGGHRLLKSPQGKLLKKKLKDVRSVLDIGCGRFPVEKALHDLGLKILVYECVDPDLSVRADYRDLHSVQKIYDCIFMLELIEHLTLETAIEYLKTVNSLLSESGILVLSTPNAAHPTHFWSIDVTHIRPYPVHDLIGLLRKTGFTGEITVYRQFHIYQSNNLFKRGIRKLLTPISKLLYRIMSLDHVQTIIVIAQR